MKNRVISIGLLIVAISLAGYLVYGIKSSIDEKERIARVERKVIEKLMTIRKAEIGFQAKYGDYTADWDSLANFIKADSFFITEKSETIITLAYGADSVIVNIDTLGTVSVMDSLFSTPEFSKYDFLALKFIPENKNKAEFEIFAGQIEKSGVKIHVIEVRDTEPADPTRSEENDGRNRKPLRFGSRTDVTTSGNWE
ncbi:MAG: hypothetical protein OEW67_15205 [Cyclobacteriaceae bacterium]|nr:hypothetical protein [Cyclobacteriaceae bacterium]